MADPVKPKPFYNCPDGYFVFDLVGLNRPVAQRARLAGPETAPKASRRLAGQLFLCDALACDGPQLFFESPEQQVGHAHSIPRSTKTVERHDGLAWGWATGVDGFRVLTRNSAASASTLRAICSLSKPDFSVGS
jgi:hypothetical protein